MLNLTEVNEEISPPRRWSVGVVTAALLAGGCQGLGTLPHVDVPRAARGPELSAAVDDADWNGAAVIPSLTLSTGPEASGLVVPATKVLLQWTDESLLVRFICEDAELYSVRSDDGTVSSGDAVEVFLDPVGDGVQFIEIQLNPAGETATFLHLCTRPAVSDAAGVLAKDIMRYDLWTVPRWPVPDLRATVIPITHRGAVTGWIADLSIPSSVLRRTRQAKFSPMKLRANFIRHDWQPAPGKSRRLVAINWSPVQWGRPHRSPAAMGTLTLINK